MTDLLNLPYWNVLKVQETDLNYVVDAAYEIEPAGCPHCGFMIRYGHGTKEEAEKQYSDWQTKIPADGLFAFRPLLTAMQNWRNEIFAYFDHQATNAYTESLNGLMKLANRMGRGYSFEVIRARILYAPENAKTTTLRSGILRDQQAYYMFPPARPRPDYFSGVKISTLVSAIRNDHFLPISTRYSE
jgi:hypothetical protein